MEESLSVICYEKLIPGLGVFGMRFRDFFAQVYFYINLFKQKSLIQTIPGIQDVLAKLREIIQIGIF